MVHLNRQAAHLQNALQESYVKVLLIQNYKHLSWIIWTAAEFNQQAEGLELSQWSLIDSMWNTVTPICGKAVWSESENVLI